MADAPDIITDTATPADPAATDSAYPSLDSLTGAFFAEMSGEGAAPASGAPADPAASTAQIGQDAANPATPAASGTAPAPESSTTPPVAPEQPPAWVQPMMQAQAQMFGQMMTGILERIAPPRQETTPPPAAAPVPGSPEHYQALARQDLGPHASDAAVARHAQALREMAAYQAFQGQPGWDTDEAKRAIEQRSRAFQERTAAERENAQLRQELAELRSTVQEIKSGPDREAQARAERDDLARYFQGVPGLRAGRQVDDAAAADHPELMAWAREADALDPLVDFVREVAADRDPAKYAGNVMRVLGKLNAIVAKARAKAPAAPPSTQTPPAATPAQRQPAPPTFTRDDERRNAAPPPENEYRPMADLAMDFSKYMQLDS